MTRLRYVVDRPRGPKGGHHDEPHLYKLKGSAEQAARERPEVRRDGQVVRRSEPRAFVIQIDLDAMLPLGASAEAEYQWHERQMLHHNAEMLRLQPHVAVPAAPFLSTSDVARIREAVSEWYIEEDRLRRGGGATPAARGAFFLLRDLWQEGKLG